MLDDPYSAPEAARSICGGWQIGMMGDRTNALAWADYIATQHGKHPTPPDLKGKAFGVSQAIGKRAREAARGMLEAREAKNGWITAVSGGRS